MSVESILGILGLVGVVFGAPLWVAYNHPTAYREHVGKIYAAMAFAAWSVVCVAVGAQFGPHLGIDGYTAFIALGFHAVGSLFLFALTSLHRLGFTKDDNSDSERKRRSRKSGSQDNT